MFSVGERSDRPGEVKKGFAKEATLELCSDFSHLGRRDEHASQGNNMKELMVVPDVGEAERPGMMGVESGNWARKGLDSTAHPVDRGRALEGVCVCVSTCV